MGRPIVMTNMRSTSSCFAFAGIPPVKTSAELATTNPARFVEPLEPRQRRNRMADNSWLARRASVGEPIEYVPPKEPAVQPLLPAPTCQWGRAECNMCHDVKWMMGAAEGESSRMTCSSCRANSHRVRKCSVCLEPCVPVDLNHQCTADAAAGLRMPVAGGQSHICKRCLGMHCDVQLKDGAHDCTCATPGCNHQLDFSVLKTLQNFRDLKKMRENNRFREGRETLLAHYEAEPQVLEWNSGKAQLCPFCYTLVQKSMGCNHMTCSCRREFQYCCGIPFRDGHYEHHKNCHTRQPHRAHDQTTSPIFNPDVGALKALKRRQLARRLAFACGTHKRLGAASVVRMLPVELVAKIVAVV